MYRSSEVFPKPKRKIKISLKNLYVHFFFLSICHLNVQASLVSPVQCVMEYRVSRERIFVMEGPEIWSCTNMLVQLGPQTWPLIRLEIAQSQNTTPPVRSTRNQKKSSWKIIKSSHISVSLSGKIISRFREFFHDIYNQTMKELFWILINLKNILFNYINENVSNK